MYEALQTKNLYDLSHTIAAPLLAETVYPWEALAGIHAFIARAGAALPAEEYDHPRETVWIHKTAKVAQTAFIGDDVIIGPGGRDPPLCVYPRQRDCRCRCGGRATPPS